MAVFVAAGIPYLSNHGSPQGRTSYRHTPVPEEVYFNPMARSRGNPVQSPLRMLHPIDVHGNPPHINCTAMPPPPQQQPPGAAAVPWKGKGAFTAARSRV